MPEALRSLSAIRYATALAALAAAALFVLWTASNAILLIFAGILFAGFLDGLTRLLGKAVPWGHGVRLAIVCAVLGLILLAGIAWGSAAVAMQGSELVATLREQVNQVLAWIEQRGIEMPAGAQVQLDDAGAGVEQLEKTTPSVGPLLPNLQGLFGPAWTAVVAILGVLSNAVVIIFLGIFFAAQPTVYRNALLLLVPPRRRGHVRAVLDETGETLRHWLLGQALTMSVIFLFTWAGLWLVGVQPAFALGLQAGLLAFIPTVGPFVSGLVIVLASLGGGLPVVLGALAVYVGAQTLESYFLTPMIQDRAISVPPAFLFASQIVLGLLFGLYGLALATPIAAIARVFILHFYVEDILDDQQDGAG